VTELSCDGVYTLDSRMLDAHVTEELLKEVLLWARRGYHENTPWGKKRRLRVRL